MLDLIHGGTATTQGQSLPKINWQHPITRNLVSLVDTRYYRDVVRGITGTATGGVRGTWRGLESMVFDGSTSVLDMGANVPDLSGNVTLFALVRVISAGTLRTVVSLRDAGNRSATIGIGASNNGYGVGDDTATSDYQSGLRGTVSLANNAYHLIVATLSGGIVQGLWIDGISQATASDGSWTNNTSTGYTIGKRVGGVNVVNGHIPLVGLFQRRLVEAEIASLTRNPWQLLLDANADTAIFLPDPGFPALPVDAIGAVSATGQPQRLNVNWANPIARDLRFAFDPIVMSDVVTGARSSAPNGVPLLVASSKGMRRKFSGTQYLSFGHRDEWNITGPMTMAFFGRFNSYGTNQHLMVSKSSGSGLLNSVVLAYINTAGLTRLQRANTLSYATQTWGAPTAGADVGVVWSDDSDPSSVGSGWIDGKPQSTTMFNGSATYVTGNTVDLRLGRSNDNSFQLDGEVGLVFLWARRLSDTEIASLTRNPWQLCTDSSAGFYIPDAESLSMLPFSEFGAVQTSQPRF